MAGTAKSNKSNGFKPASKPEPNPRVDAAEGKIDGETVTHLTIRALTPGFRRAGRAWSADEVTESVDEFTAEQVEQLLAEPQLVVIPVAMGDAK